MCTACSERELCWADPWPVLGEAGYWRPELAPISASSKLVKSKKWRVYRQSNKGVSETTKSLFGKSGEQERVTEAQLSILRALTVVTADTSLPEEQHGEAHNGAEAVGLSRANSLNTARFQEQEAGNTCLLSSA